MIFQGLKKKDNQTYEPHSIFVIDKNTSVALKGIACIFILMAHYGQRKSCLIDNPGFLTKAVWNITANIGLIWFMFFSGYGLSLKEYKQHVSKQWIKRFSRIFFPMFFVGVLSTILYFFLPVIFTAEEAKTLWISENIAYLHSDQFADFVHVLPGIIGWPDWYVYCILIFYSLFYVSVYLSIRFKQQQIYILIALFLGYFLFAYKLFGPGEAHWYRYIWTFLLGHIVAKHKEYGSTKALLFIIPFLSLTILEDRITLLNYFLGIYSLLCCSFIGKYVTIKSSSAIYTLGTISYFYYLVHVRVGYQLLTYMGIDSVLIWSIFTCIIAYVFQRLYSLSKSLISR